MDDGVQKDASCGQSALLEKNPSATVQPAIQEHFRSFPSDAEVFGAGYTYISGKAGDKVRDASHILEGKDDAYLDVVHFLKPGSKLVGEYIHSTLD